MTTPSTPTVALSTAPPRPGFTGNQSDLIVCWERLAEFVAKYLTKGRAVFIVGRLSYREWEGADGQKRRTAEIVASELIPLDRRPEPDLHVVDADDTGDLPF